MTGIAALSMYDLPEIRKATDAWWQTIAASLRAEGVPDVPSTLDRSRPVSAIWRDPLLVLSQTCGYPLTHEFAHALTAIAVPTYAADGCTPGRYRSAFLVRSDDPAAELDDLRDRRVAANSPDSQSGCNALRAAIAPLSRGGRFFSEVIWSGMHRASIAAVRSGKADVAAVDAVSFALISRHAPDETSGLRVLDWSADAPALPYATRRSIDPVTRARLTAGLVRAAEDPSGADARATLLIDGLSEVDDRDYSPFPEMRKTAERLGYPQLA
jgi:ABC-type phosphate/phosphonate transport system substrate-binding protein